MKQETEKILCELWERVPVLNNTLGSVRVMFDALYNSYAGGGRLYLCGNGGSASDCEHIAGELLKNFRLRRSISTQYREKLLRFGETGARLAEKLEGSLPVVSLCGHPAFTTAFANDKDPQLSFAQQVSALGRADDVLLTLSTSGNSENCVLAAVAAKAKGMRVLFLGGGSDGKLKEIADVSVIVPEKETFKVQELHLPVYHCLCAMLENEFFG